MVMKHTPAITAPRPRDTYPALRRALLRALTPAQRATYRECCQPTKSQEKGDACDLHA